VSLPQTRHHHGCGSFDTVGNDTVLVVFGGMTGKTEYLNDILVLSMNFLSLGWKRFEASNLPYSNIILKSFVLYLDDNQCDLMFVGIDGIYFCKKNFIWTKKIITIDQLTKFTWSGIARLHGCWNDIIEK